MFGFSKHPADGILDYCWVIASFAFVVRLALPPTSNAMRETRTPE